MIIRSTIEAIPAQARKGVWCIGNFDGVHRGHRQLLQEAKRLAAQRGAPWGIMTFDPHPATLLGRPRLPLMTLEQRCEVLGAFQPDLLLVLPVTEAFLAMNAENFLQKILHDALEAQHLVEGTNFTFGNRAAGTVETLQTLGPRYGFSTTIMPLAHVALSNALEVGVSSTLVRWLLEQGRVQDASRCLGRPYTLRGPVVRGDQRGRTIGFPTINMQVEQLLPQIGVYGGRVRVGSTYHRAAISIGTNPTFAGHQMRVEAHLLDFQGDLYGQVLDLEFFCWIREQRTFSGLASLQAQLQRDVQQIRQRPVSLGETP